MRLVYRVTVRLSQQIGIEAMMKGLFKPLFGFGGFLSRINGFVIRTLMLIFGLVAVLLLLSSSVIVYLTLLYSYVFVFSKSVLYGLVYVFITIVYFIYRLHSARGDSIKDFSDIDEILASGTDYERSLIANAKSDDFKKLAGRFASDQRIIELITRAELDKQEVFEFISSELQNASSAEMLSYIKSINSELKLKYLSKKLIFTAFFLHFKNSYDFLMKCSSTDSVLKYSLLYTIRIHQEDPKIWENDYLIPPSGGIDKAWAVGYTAVLNRFSTDLTKLALRGGLPKLIGRDEAKNQVIAILSKASRNNVLLVGESGCGKTTFVHALAREIALGTSIPALRFKRIVSLDISTLTSGTPGEINDRLSAITKEIVSAGNIILFVDEIHNLSSTLSDDPNAVSVFSTLEPYLSEGRFQFIGATSKTNYYKYIRPNDAFSKAFDLVEMNVATKDETLRILIEMAKELETSKKGLIVTFPAIQSSYELSDKYISTSSLPDKAVELLNQACANGSKTLGGGITKDVVTSVVSEMINMPLSSIQQNERKILIGLDKLLHKQVIGQDAAIKAISDAIKRARAGVRDDNKPIASFLFSGPTGVGKTETAKALASVYYGSEKSMLRFDMSEYQDVQSIRRLIGDETGTPGLLTTKVRARPYSLLLFDEVEKASENVINIFLQILDDGRLTDAMGILTDFSNTLIIMTSNVGTKSITSAIKDRKSLDEIRAVAVSELKNKFPLEFLNRFSALIPFHPLSEEQIIQIAKLKLKKLQDKLIAKQIRVGFSETLVKQVANLGYSDEWGARPINRVIEEKIETPIADKIISGEIKSGDKFVMESI